MGGGKGRRQRAEQMRGEMRRGEGRADEGKGLMRRGGER
jgi:hypothetical protein